MAHPSEPEVLDQALSGIGVDEKLLVSILRKSHMRKGCSKFFCEDERQFERWNHTAIKSLKAEFKRFKDVVVLSLMHPWERDARLLKKALKKGPMQYNVIVEIACIRSSDELLGARKAYHSLFDRSIEEDLASHIQGSERKLLVALVSAYRYEGPKVKEDTARLEAKALLNAIKNNDKRNAMEDDEVVRILTTRSKPHLKEVYEQYKKFSDKTITEDLEVELLLKETVECLCTPQTYFTRVFDAALRDDADEDAKKALTRLVATQESEEMKGVATKFEGKIKERVKGAYKDVLVGMLEK
ncbi:annexin 4 [Hibiscus trionum]|uniref:Annexin 4 n=1 Tax=Hibiscus trionum TaxID=183268 RepID=A0A9W7I8E5_HIBTR|nr:annexin 4 [Hibiscus trionum]GMI90461.1 annexin 4 [Hibiscus trionum]